MRQRQFKNPEQIIGEILGERAHAGADPSSKHFTCPFINSRCTKRSTSIKESPYPVCSILSNDQLICVCPKRFYAVDFLRDVIDRGWPWLKPENPKIAHEVKMTGFGNVDFVIADVKNGGEIGQFLSVELQAIDITGTVMPAYQALLSGSDLSERFGYGLNWDNVYKRYVTQLIRKGYYHHHWKSKIVAVLQEPVYRSIVERADFMRSEKIDSENVNIIFMVYRFENDPSKPQEYRLALTTVEGTSHANIQQAFLYKKAPSRDEFCSQIKRSLEHGK